MLEFAEARDPGIVVELVNTAELLADVTGIGADRVRLGDVQIIYSDDRAPGLARPGGLFCRGGVDVRYCQAGALPREGDRERPAYSRTRASDDGHLADEIAHSASPLRLLVWR